MKRRSRELNVFSMATIDLFACATGAFILLTLVLLPYYLDVDRDIVHELRAALAAREAELEETRATLATREDELAASRDARAACRDELAASARENAALRAELARSEAELRAELGELRAANAALTASNGELERAVERCNSVAQQSFVLVLMSWKTSDDIDLHVIDPEDRRFYFSRRNHRGSAGTFEEDSTRGPGNEIWLHPAAEPGEYAITFNLYRRRSEGPIVVRGAVFHQRGRLELPTTTLREQIGDRHAEAPLVALMVVDEEGRVTLR